MYVTLQLYDIDKENDDAEWPHLGLWGGRFDVGGINAKKTYKMCVYVCILIYVRRNRTYVMRVYVCTHIQYDVKVYETRAK